LYRIPSDFLWPKLDKLPSSRPALTTITNQTLRLNMKRSSKRNTSSSSTVPILKTETHLPIVNSDNNNHGFFSTTDCNNFNVPSPHHLTTDYSDQLQVK